MSEEKELSPIGEFAQSILETLESTLNDSSIIQDNKLNFFIESNLYRCRMPNQREKSEAEDRKNRLYVKLLQDGGYLTKKQLTKLLKEKQDIDIEALEEQKAKLYHELQDTYLTLAPKLSEETEIITALKEKIALIKSAYMKVAHEIVSYLNPCIEDRLEKEYVEYLTYLCTEQYKDETWSKVWVSYDDFQSKNSKLENKAVEHFVYLFINVRD